MDSLIRLINQAGYFESFNTVLLIHMNTTFEHNERDGKEYTLLG
jgi:hypothetical protein